MPLGSIPVDDWRAIGGIVAAAVAVLGGVFGGLSKFRTFLRERKTGFDASVATDLFVVDEGETPSFHIYVRLRIRAHAGGAALTRAQVRLVSCEPPPALDGTTKSHQREFYLAFRTAHDHQEAMLLSPGEARHVDLLRIRALNPEAATLTLAPTPSSPREGYVLQPGCYTLGLRVTAPEARAREFELRVQLSGQWSGNEDDADKAIAPTLVELPGSKPDAAVEKQTTEESQEQR